MRYVLLLLGLLFPPDLPGQYGREFSYSDYRYALAGTDEWQPGLPREMGQYRIRLTVTVKMLPDTSLTQALYLGLLYASEVYWDEQFLGRNGTVGADASAEIPGLAFTQFVLPRSWLTPGEHEVELRASNWHAAGKVRFYGVWVAPYLTPVVGALRLTALMYIYAGCFLVIGLFYAFRFFVQRGRIDVLVFAAICLAFTALVIMEYLRSYYFYPYPWHFVRLRIILGISQFIGLGLPLFFALRFRFGNHWIYLPPLILLYGAAWWLARYTFDYATNWSVIAGVAFAAGLTVWAASKRKTGSRLALLGILPLLLGLTAFPDYYDYLLYVGFGHLVLMILLSLAVREREQNQERERVLLQSTRLELELLKKNIQPHFLMNSLHSAIDWIEENPARGIDLLLALGEECQLLLESADQKLIPLEREIELCRRHLQIMGYRKLEEFRFTVPPLPSDWCIPPAVLLTLIENGLSHQRRPSFALRFGLEGKWRYLELAVSDDPAVLGNVSSIARENPTGTGLRYVRARLRESFGDGNWNLTDGPLGSGWGTRIDLRYYQEDN